MATNDAKLRLECIEFDVEVGGEAGQSIGLPNVNDNILCDEESSKKEEDEFFVNGKGSGSFQVHMYANLDGSAAKNSREMGEDSSNLIITGLCNGVPIVGGEFSGPNEGVAQDGSIQNVNTLMPESSKKRYEAEEWSGVHEKSPMFLEEVETIRDVDVEDLEESPNQIRRNTVEVLVASSNKQITQSSREYQISHVISGIFDDRLIFQGVEDQPKSSNIDFLTSHSLKTYPAEKWSGEHESTLAPKEEGCANQAEETGEKVGEMLFRRQISGHAESPGSEDSEDLVDVISNGVRVVKQAAQTSMDREAAHQGEEMKVLGSVEEARPAHGGSPISVVQFQALSTVEEVAPRRGPSLEETTTISGEQFQPLFVGVKAAPDVSSSVQEETRFTATQNLSHAPKAKPAGSPPKILNPIDMEAQQKLDTLVGEMQSYAKNKSQTMSLQGENHVTTVDPDPVTVEEEKKITDAYSELNNVLRKLSGEVDTLSNKVQTGIGGTFAQSHIETKVHGEVSKNSDLMNSLNNIGGVLGRLSSQTQASLPEPLEKIIQEIMTTCRGIAVPGHLKNVDHKIESSSFVTQSSSQDTAGQKLTTEARIKGQGPAPVKVENLTEKLVRLTDDLVKFTGRKEREICIETGSKRVNNQTHVEIRSPGGVKTVLSSTGESSGPKLPDSFLENVSTILKNVSEKVGPSQQSYSIEKSSSYSKHETEKIRGTPSRVAPSAPENTPVSDLDDVVKSQLAKMGIDLNDPNVKVVKSTTSSGLQDHQRGSSSSSKETVVNVQYSREKNRKTNTVTIDGGAITNVEGIADNASLHKLLQDTHTDQQQESTEEGFLDEHGNVVVSKKITRIVTTTKSVSGSEPITETIQTIEEQGTASPSSTGYKALLSSPSSVNEQLIRLKVNENKFEGIMDDSQHIQLHPTRENAERLFSANIPQDTDSFNIDHQQVNDGSLSDQLLLSSSVKRISSLSDHSTSLTSPSSACSVETTIHQAGASLIKNSGGAPPPAQPSLFDHQKSSSFESDHCSSPVTVRDRIKVYERNLNIKQQIKDQVVIGDLFLEEDNLSNEKSKVKLSDDTTGPKNFTAESVTLHSTGSSFEERDYVKSSDSFDIEVIRPQTLPYDIVDIFADNFAIELLLEAVLAVKEKGLSALLVPVEIAVTPATPRFEMLEDPIEFARPRISEMDTNVIIPDEASSMPTTSEQTSPFYGYSFKGGSEDIEAAVSSSRPQSDDELGKYGRPDSALFQSLSSGRKSEYETPMSTQETEYTSAQSHLPTSSSSQSYVSAVSNLSQKSLTETESETLAGSRHDSESDSGDNDDQTVEYDQPHLIKHPVLVLKGQKLLHSPVQSDRLFTAMAENQDDQIQCIVEEDQPPLSDNGDELEKISEVSESVKDLTSPDDKQLSPFLLKSGISKNLPSPREEPVEFSSSRSSDSLYLKKASKQLVDEVLLESQDSRDSVSSEDNVMYDMEEQQKELQAAGIVILRSNDQEDFFQSNLDTVPEEPEIESSIESSRFIAHLKKDKRGGSIDNVSETSLQEFERFERELALKGGETSLSNSEVELLKRGIAPLLSDNIGGSPQQKPEFMSLSDIHEEIEIDNEPMHIRKLVKIPDQLLSQMDSVLESPLSMSSSIETKTFSTSTGQPISECYTFTMYESKTDPDDSSLEVIRTVSTKKTDPVSETVRFTGLDSEEQFQNYVKSLAEAGYDYEEVESLDESGNVTKTVIRRIRQ
uniref:Uncharacterized protein n=1 Tax=Romanomermis culicivorax TaxID=13658 RepID=A0A915J2K0_ROMCU